jgi:copper chaperone NosL
MFAPAPARGIARRLVRALALAAALATAAAACGERAPRELAYGDDTCGYCRMTISDPRFGAQAISSKGKITTFDSIECLASFHLQSRGDAGHSVWVSDFRAPGTWLAAEAAVFVRGGTHHSPMGLGLLAVSATADTAALRSEFGGDALTWAEVLALVEREGDRRGAAGPGAGDAHAHR